MDFFKLGQKISPIRIKHLGEIFTYQDSIQIDHRVERGNHNTATYLLSSNGIGLFVDKFNDGALLGNLKISQDIKYRSLGFVTNLLW